ASIAFGIGLSDDERTSLARMLAVFNVAAEQRNSSAAPSESPIPKAIDAPVLGALQKPKQKAASQRVTTQPKTPRSPAQQKPKAQVKQPPAKR
ncbi:hypothetical protein JTM27_38240, partial [Pseudomonas aeruginosa]|nr:hypothetical protein [Pseudomonas aeruginosa]